MKKICLVILLLILTKNVYAVPVTYAITVSSNESEELKKLLKQVSSNLEEEDKILIQVDKDNYDQDVINVINYYAAKVAQNQFKVVFFPLNKDFGAFKNNLLKEAGDKGFMFQIDADELLSYSLMQNFKYFLAKNQDADLIMVPRANYYINMEEREDFQSMYRDGSDQLGRFRYPDLQGKLINLSNKKIQYKDKLHEGIINANKVVTMPHDKLNASWDLIHLKTMKKQHIADKFYQEMGQN